MPDLVHAAQRELYQWSWLDWLIALFLGASTWTAFGRGFIRSLVSLAAVCLGTAAAVLYSPAATPALLAWCGSPVLARTVGFFLVLLAVYVSLALLGRVLRRVCQAVGLGFFDRLAGAAFGFVRGTLLLAALLLPLSPYLEHFAPFRSSVLLPYLLQVSHGVFSVLPRDAGRYLSMVSRAHVPRW